MKRLVTGFALLAPLAAHAVVATTSRTTAAPASVAWSGVGMMNGGSAVAVGEHLVLTAGHVGAGDFMLGGVLYHMTSSIAAPRAKGTSVDLSLVTVAETLPTWYAVASSVKTGATVTMVGYGGTGVVSPSGKGYTLTGGGVEHAGTDRLSSKETTSGHGPTMRAMLDKAGEAVLAPGDSGGGWFSGGLLVGISDFVFTKDKGKADYGFAKKAYFGSGAVDLTNGTLRSWLEGEIAADADASPILSRGALAPGGVQAVPEPSALAALGLGGLILVRRQTVLRASNKTSGPPCGGTPQGGHPGSSPLGEGRVGVGPSRSAQVLLDAS